MSEKHDLFSAEKHAITKEDYETELDPPLRVMRSLAAIGVVFGTVAMVSLPFGLIRFHEGAITGDAMVSLFTLPVQSPSPQVLWLFFSSLLGAGLGLILLLGSIAALSFHHSARPILMLWAISSLIVGGCGSLFYFRWLLPPWRDQWAQVRGVIDVLVNFGGWAVGSSLAIAMLIMLMHPRVKEGFELH